MAADDDEHEGVAGMWQKDSWGIMVDIFGAASDGGGYEMAAEGAAEDDGDEDDKDECAVCAAAAEVSWSICSCRRRRQRTTASARDGRREC